MAEVVAIIPARGGSKGVPRKNLRPLAGKPLIVHSIEHARGASQVGAVFVSTDDAEIAEVSRRAGAQVVRRPAEISGDQASSESALQHALAEIGAQGTAPSLVVFLQCTSPLRSSADIDAAIGKLRQAGADSLVSVAPSHRFLWEERDGAARPLNYDFTRRPRRQDWSQFVENGSIYVFKPWVLKDLGCRLGGKVALHVMHPDSTWEIDTEADFAVTEALLRSHA
jgi:CMP-N,N'-diacetyllegionaminic acid synthase